MTVMTFGFTFIFPLVFASNISVDPATMPGWLEAFVNVNPVSHMTTALRGLFAGTATAGQVGLALLGPAVITPALAPVVWMLYRRA
jgi:ABC-2 type transport system permease protein